MLYSMKWIGTYNEFTQYIEMVNEVSGAVSGMTFKGAYVPSDEWNYTLLFDLDQYANALEVYQTFIKKYSQPDVRSNIAYAKWTLLHTFEELGYPV
jgi:hypothetical protein